MEQKDSSMYDDLKKQAKKTVEAKVTINILAVVFTFSAMVLLVLSLFIPAAGYWLRLPIPILALTWLFLYAILLGIPNADYMSKDWKEKEIEKEIAKIYRKKNLSLPPPEDLSDEDRLELRELERLKKKWDKGEDYV